MGKSDEGMSTAVEIPKDILDLVTSNGTNELPGAANALVIVVRLRAYWGRIAELAGGRSFEAEQWLYVYKWAVEQERKFRKISEA